MFVTEINFARAILLNGNTATRRFNPEYRRLKGTLRFLKALDCLKDKADETKACLKVTSIDRIVQAVPSSVSQSLNNNL